MEKQALIKLEFELIDIQQQSIESFEKITQLLLSAEPTNLLEADHGIFDEVIVRGTKDLRAIPTASGIMPEALQNIMVVNYVSAESIKILEEQVRELAANLGEPVPSRRPDIQPQDFLHQLRRITEQSKTVLIFDEIITGFRMAQEGAQAYFGVQADIATYRKAVGRGILIKCIYLHIIPNFWREVNEKQR